MIKIRSSLLEFLQWRGDNWMVRALYLAQLLKEHDVDAQHVLKMERKEIYPLLDQFKEQDNDPTLASKTS